MTLKEIKIIAKNLGVAARSMKKAELIQAIQKAENNTPCFGTSGGSCDQEQCCWRPDCLKVKVK